MPFTSLFCKNKIQFSRNEIQFSRNEIQFGTNESQFGTNEIQFSRNKVQFGIKSNWLQIFLIKFQCVKFFSVQNH